MAIKNVLLLLLPALLIQVQAVELHPIYGTIKKKDDLYVTEYLQCLPDSNNTKFHALYYKQAQLYEVYHQTDVTLEGQVHRSIVLHKDNYAKELFDRIQQNYITTEGNRINGMAYTPQPPRVL